MLTSSVFLLPNWTFFAELILFVVVLGVVAKWILPPIQQTLHERARLLRGATQAASEHRDETEHLVAEREALMRGAREEARRILEESRRRVEALRQLARERGEVERRERVEEALAAFEADRASLRSEVLRDVGPLVVRAAEVVLGAPVDIERHHLVVEAAVRSLAVELAPGASGGDPASDRQEG